MEFKAAKKQENTNLGELGTNTQLTNPLNHFNSSMHNRCVHCTCLLLRVG